MLTTDEYNSLLPYKENLLQGTARKTELHIIDAIRQRLGYGSICFDCSGSIANAVRDIQNLINDYERIAKKSS